MSDPTRTVAKKGPAQPAPAGGEPTSRSWLSWVMGWLVVPTVFLASIFGGGVLYGAHFPESWWTRSVLWVAGLF